MKDIINNNKIHSILNKTNVHCSIYVSFVIKTKKGSRIFYHIVTGVNDVNTHFQGHGNLGQINENDWK